MGSSGAGSEEVGESIRGSKDGFIVVPWSFGEECCVDAIDSGDIRLFADLGMRQPVSVLIKRNQRRTGRTEALVQRCEPVERGIGIVDVGGNAIGSARAWVPKSQRRL